MIFLNALFRKLVFIADSSGAKFCVWLLHRWYDPSQNKAFIIHVLCMCERMKITTHTTTCRAMPFQLQHVCWYGYKVWLYSTCFKWYWGESNCVYRDSAVNVVYAFVYFRKSIENCTRVVSNGSCAFLSKSPSYLDAKSEAM